MPPFPAQAATAHTVSFWKRRRWNRTASQEGLPWPRVGFGPASAADILTRLVSKRIEAKLGQSVIVENRAGNSSMIAAEAVARASADGYTLFMATIANTLNPAQTKSDFDLGKMLAPIALLGVVPNVLVAHPSVPAGNLNELKADQ